MTKLRVLILEDSLADPELMVAELRRHGFDPAWQRVERRDDFLRALSAKPAVILADYKVPGFGAPEALQLLKELGLDIPFILVSGAIGEETAVEMMKLGAANYVLKDHMTRLSVAVEHALAEQSLRRERQQAQERFRLLADTAQDFVFVIDRDLRVGYVNQFGAKVLRRPAAEISGRPVAELFPPDTAERQIHNLKAVFATGNPLYLRNQSEFPDKPRWLDTRLVPIRDNADRPEEVTAVFGISRDVTEERRIWQDLQASENKYRTLLSGIRDGVFTLDRAGRFTYVNEVVAQRVQRPVEWFIGRSYLDLVNPEDRERVRREVDDMLKGNQLPPHERAYYSATGELRYIETLTVPLREGGEIVGLLGVSRDITKRKELEAAVKESEENFRNIAKNANDGIIVSSPEGKHIFANERAAEIMGYSLAEFMTLDLTKTASPEELARLRENLRKRMSGEELARQYETAMRRKDGSLVLVEIAGARTVWQGKPANLVVFRDITRRKEAEEALLESEERYRALVQMAPDAVVVHRHGKIVFANPAAVKMVGARREEELVGRPVLELVHPDSRLIAQERIRRMIQEDTAAPTVEEKFLRLDGTVVDVEVTATPIIYSKRPSIMVVFRDITERKAAANRILRLNRVHALLSRVNKLIARGGELQEIFSQTCQAGVEQGGFALVWIGLLNPDQQELVPVTQYGKHDDYLASVHDAVRRSAGASGRLGMSMHQHRITIINDYEAEPEVSAWRVEALRRGYRSAAGFPLTVSSGPVGCVVFHSGEPNYFDAEQVSLLETLAADLSFAWERHELETQRQAADRERRESEQRFVKVFEEGLSGKAILDIDFRFRRANPALAKLLAKTEEELLGESIFDFIAPDKRAAEQERFAQLARGKVASFQRVVCYQTGAGKRLGVVTSATTVTDDAGKPMHIVLMTETPEHARPVFPTRSSPRRRPK